MTTLSKRQRRLLATKLNKQKESELEEIDLLKSLHAPSWMTRAYRNNRYIVMINDHAKTDKGEAIRAMIQKVDDTPILGHWSEIQKIKNQIFGPETVAVEYYPSESKLVDDHNIYWIWIYPKGILPIPI